MKGNVAELYIFILPIHYMDKYRVYRIDIEICEAQDSSYEPPTRFEWHKKIKVTPCHSLKNGIGCRRTPPMTSRETSDPVQRLP